MLEMVFIKGGYFEMGDTFGDGDSDEKPVHTVCVDDFYIGRYKVTQREWKEIMGNNPSFFKDCDDCPVERVSWNKVQTFLKRLNERTGKSYRLLTEAEWEYAVRSGGKKEKWSGTSDEVKFGEYAWYWDNSGKRTHPVGQKRPNGLGLYDMSGNVWEWCSDWYGWDYYKESPKNNPKGPDGGKFKVLRGGSWLYRLEYGRASNRDWWEPEYRNSNIGFRLVLPIPLGDVR